MTGAELTALRWAWNMGSVERLAARLGCHPSTIRRSERRATVTPYVAALIETHPTCPRFIEGMEWGRYDHEINSRRHAA